MPRTDTASRVGLVGCVVEEREFDVQGLFGELVGDLELEGVEPGAVRLSDGASFADVDILAS